MFTRRWSMFFCPLYFKVGKEGQYIYHSLQNQMQSLLPCTLLYLSLEMVTQSPKKNLQINIAYVVNFFVKSVWNLSRDICQKGITRIFCPIVNKNGYNYEFTKNLVYKKAKKLWMVVDQSPFMPTSKLIFFGIARRLACKKMGKSINWVMYVEWTSSEQQHYKERLKQVDLLNFYKEIDDEPMMEEVCGQLIECISIIECTIWLLWIHVAKWKIATTISMNRKYFYKP